MRFPAETVRAHRLIVLLFIAVIAMAGAAMWPASRCERRGSDRPTPRVSAASPDDLVLQQCGRIVGREIAAELVRIDDRLDHISNDLAGAVRPSELLALKQAIVDLEVRLARLAALRAACP